MKSEKLIEVSKGHFEAVKTKNIEKIIDFYARSEDLLVFVEGPRWATLSYKMVEKGWRDFVDSAIVVKDCNWIEFLQSQELGNMGFVAGIVKMNLEINGQPKTVKFRGTFIFEREASDKWRVIHEHFSQPAADPYGIGDWLKKD